MVSMLEPLQRGYKKHKGDLFIQWDGHNSEIANHIIAQEGSRAMLIALGQGNVSRLTPIPAGHGAR